MSTSHPIDVDGVLISEQAAHPYPANDPACPYDVKDRDKRSSADDNLVSSVWISNHEIRLVKRIPKAASGGVFADPIPPANYAVLIQHRAL
jgi:hypothetical protein